jgi:CBS domain-containing protein
MPCNDPHTAFEDSVIRPVPGAAYNHAVLHFSIPVGRWLGVHVRVHVSLFLLLALAAGYSAVATGSIMRGLALWLALCAAVIVREVARAITAAYGGAPARALFLLPVGGVMALAPRQSGAAPANTRLITAIGSAANFTAALVLLGFAYGIDPRVSLLAQPWITIEHVLRSAVWLQVVVGAVNLIPASALPSRRLLRPKAAAAAKPVAKPSPLSPRPAFGFATAFALALMLSGLVFAMLWPFLLGLTLLFTSYLNRAAGAGAVEAMNVTVRDVMLTEYRPLNANTTLRDALLQATHTVHDLFPVLRGERLVGWISRGSLTTKLQLEGDGFLQGAMSRSLQMAQPGEKIGDALRRAAALGASEFIPVVEDGAMIGMLTPGSLERAVGQLRLARQSTERSEQ